MKRFEITISDEEQKILENDLVDIGQWVTGAIVGKINQCRKRAASAYRELLKKEGAEMVPANDTVAVNQYFNRLDYKNRKQREVKSGEIKPNESVAKSK